MINSVIREYQACMLKVKKRKAASSAKGGHYPLTTVMMDECSGPLKAPLFYFKPFAFSSTPSRSTLHWEYLRGSFIIFYLTTHVKLSYTKSV